MDKNGIGTDATIAEHIAKVIERKYVMQVKEGKTNYLVPSTLGIGLIEGYNQLNLEKSLSKPLLRRETEFRMSLICAGQRTKGETITESIEEYREVFALTSRQFDRIAETVLQYLTDPNAGQEARAVELLERDDEDDDVGPAEDDSDDDFDDHGGGGGGGGNGRAAPRGRAANGRGRGAASTRGTRGGRGGGRPPAQRFDPPDDDDDNDFNRGGGRPPAGRTNTNRNNASSSRSSNGNSGQIPQCQCGDPAVQRTTNKAGPNQGRQFFACAKPMGDASKCDFFEWSDDSAAATTTKSIPAKRGASTFASSTDSDVERGGWSTSMRSGNGNGNGGGGAAAEGPRRCDCNLQATLKNVTKAGPNKGKAFWSCARESPKLRCQFFEWDDGEATNALQNNGFNNNGSGGRNNYSNANGGGGGGAGGGGECFRCGTTGHWASECTGQPLQLQQSSSSRGRGTKRKTSGSTRGGGRGGKKSAGSGGGKGKDDACFRCGKMGHWSSECPGT